MSNTTENTARSSGRVGNLRPRQPGQSGNPGGRPKGLVSRIRSETCDGAELVEFMLGVFRDQGEPTRARVEAASWLADRGFGKPQQTTLLASAEAEATDGLREMPRAELVRLPKRHLGLSEVA